MQSAAAVWKNLRTASRPLTIAARSVSQVTGQREPSVPDDDLRSGSRLRSQRRSFHPWSELTPESVGELPACTGQPDEAGELFLARQIPISLARHADQLRAGSGGDPLHPAGFFGPCLPSVPEALLSAPSFPTTNALLPQTDMVVPEQESGVRWDWESMRWESERIGHRALTCYLYVLPCTNQLCDRFRFPCHDTQS